MANLTRFENSDIVNDVQKVVTSTWSDNTNNLTTQFTSSAKAIFTTATSSGAHFIEVFHDATSASAQFAVAYGNKAGSGSLDFTNDTGAIGNSPSKNIYNQYRQLVFGDEGSNFSFNGHVPDSIFVINVNRARYNIVSGSLGTMSGSQLTQVPSTSGSYGLFYPDTGIIILNGDAISHRIESCAVTASANTANNNHRKLVQHLSASSYFIVDSEEKVSSQFYFARAKNNQYNYTTNPSFVDNSGNVNISSFADNPTTFITTVGLYNDNNDLVAVAKLSQPVTKDFTKEALIRVKLDY